MQPAKHDLWNRVGVPRMESNKLEHGCRMVYAGILSFFGLGLEDGMFQLSDFSCRLNVDLRIPSLRKTRQILRHVSSSLVL